ncbi:hypothetical protein [Algoriphagus namhaensis]
MKNNPIHPILLVIIVFMACTKSPGDSPQSSSAKSTESRQRTSSTEFGLQTDLPLILDSTDWVLYPLPLEGDDDAKADWKVSSYGDVGTFWNIAFFRPATQEVHLLSDSLKMRILSISPMNLYGQGTGSISSRHIYYSLQSEDLDQDGQLTSKDPKYLFVSSLDGSNFKQISPEDMDLIHWQPISSGSKVLIQARNDRNQDQQFTEEDEIISFVYDLTADRLDPVFDRKFVQKSKDLYERQWSPKAPK